MSGPETSAGQRLLSILGGTADADYLSPIANAISAIEAEARAAAVAPLEKALREWWALWDDVGPESGKHRVGRPLVTIPGDMRERHEALLSAPSPVREPEGLDVERLAQALSCWTAPISGEGDPEFVAWAAQMIRSYRRTGGADE